METQLNHETQQKLLKNTAELLAALQSFYATLEKFLEETKDVQAPIGDTHDDSVPPPYHRCPNTEPAELECNPGGKPCA